MNDWHAYLSIDPGIWGCGTSLDEAVGDLVRSHPEKFGIKIELTASDQGDNLIKKESAPEPHWLHGATTYL